MPQEILYPNESYAIMGACFAVYKEMGCGYLEAVYQECLERELAIRDIPHVSQSPLTLAYRGVPLQQFYLADIVCYGKIILELKAVQTLNEQHRAQIGNYLKSTGMKLGILLNFGHYPQIQSQRFVASAKWQSPAEENINHEIHERTRKAVENSDETTL